VSECPAERTPFRYEDFLGDRQLTCCFSFLLISIYRFTQDRVG
jgi:hypothetical protein